MNQIRGLTAGGAECPAWWESKTNILIVLTVLLDFPDGSAHKESACQCRRCKRLEFDPWVGKIPWRKAWLPTPVLLPGKSHGQRSLTGYSPWGLRVRHH